MSRKLISFDWAIKKILRSKANFAILEGFLSELLFTDITILEVLESESNQETQTNKFNRVDIKVKNSQQQIIIVEVQYSRELDYLHRLLFASSKNVAEHLAMGESYYKVAKVISISILYFNVGQGDDYIYYGSSQFIGMHTKQELLLDNEQKQLYSVNKVADIYPEYYLIEVKNFDDVAKNTLDEWVYFLKNEEIKEDFKAKGLAEAKAVLDVLKMSDDERAEYERFQEQLHFDASMYHSTYERGERIGIEKGILSTAKKMKQKGLEVEFIAEVTGLSSNDIEQL
jgi:predicted transposase/invertase (TIGR01784 family)